MKRKSARRAASLAPDALLNIQQLARRKNIPPRSIRTLLAKGVIGCFRFGHRMVFFSGEQFDRDIRAYEVKSRFANGKGMNPKSKFEPKLKNKQENYHE